MFKTEVVYPLKMATGHHYYRLSVKDWGPISRFDYTPTTPHRLEHYIIQSAGGTIITTVHDTIRRGTAEKGLRTFRLIEVVTSTGETFFCVVQYKRLLDIAQRCLHYSTKLNAQQLQVFGDCTPRGRRA